jgi:peptide/nickel transport system substrate-binding protein
MMKKTAILCTGLLLAAGAAQAAGTLRIGLGDDPDLLDPATGGSYSGRIVFAALCDKLIDIDAGLNFVPQLATAWSWSPDNLTLTLTLRDGVRFQDGEPVDAEAVHINLDRYHNAPESLRKNEVKPIASVEVADPHTVRLHLSQPYAPLTAVLADRAGMLVAPNALKELGANVGTHPVCAGPFKFTERVAQDRIVLDRFDGYWNADSIFLDRIVYRPMPDTTVRLVNLQSGQIDMIERTAPSDAAAVKANPHLRLLPGAGLAYQSVFINTHNGPAADNPLGRDARVRQALAKSIDREAFNKVVLDGQMIPSNQVEAPGTPYWNPDRRVPPRDLAGARALLKAAGHDKVSFTFTIGTSPIEQQAGEIIQSMAAEAGFDIKLRQMEANAAVTAGQHGDYQMIDGIWSGRPDPDGNISIWIASDGFLNWGHYNNPQLDALLNQARSITDKAKRQVLYRQISDIYLDDVPFIVLYHQNWLFSTTDKLTGFKPVPDGLIRPQGLQLKE